jgi:ribonuclease P protein component
MLKKPMRLSSKYEFNKTRRFGKVFNGNHSRMYIYKPENYNGPSKVGFVVSNKLSKSAVRRNRIRRIFREAVRSNYDKIKPGYWIVIYPKFNSINNKYEEINTDIVEILQKVPFTR